MNHIELYENVASSLWNELTLPALNRDQQPEAQIEEAQIFWRIVQAKYKPLAEFIEQFEKQRKHDVKRLKAARQNYQNACNAFFQPALETVLVRPLLAALNMHAFNKYENLFQD